MSSKSKQQNEDWMNRKWRPMMAWMYFAVCITDFVIFPILWSMLQAYYDGKVTEAWNPLTIQGAGLFHLAMGAILGIAAWSRGQEKIAGANMVYQPAAYYPQQQEYYTPAMYQSQPRQVIVGYGGKKAPPPAYEPLI